MNTKHPMNTTNPTIYSLNKSQLKNSSDQQEYIPSKFFEVWSSFLHKTVLSLEEKLHRSFPYETLEIKIKQNFKISILQFVHKFHILKEQADLLKLSRGTYKDCFENEIREQEYALNSVKTKLTEIINFLNELIEKNVISGLEKLDKMMSETFSFYLSLIFFPTYIFKNDIPDKFKLRKNEFSDTYLFQLKKYEIFYSNTKICLNSLRKYIEKYLMEEIINKFEAELNSETPHESLAEKPKESEIKNDESEC